jgi:hypothetical protein
VRTLLEQLEIARRTRLYYLSLMTALTVPDIAGALDSEDGRATGERYANWYEKWVRPRSAEAAAALTGLELPVDQLNPLTGEDCYHFRCSLLHQGTTLHAKSSFERIIFIEPGTSRHVIHNVRMKGALCIDLPTFCGEIIAGGTLWLDAVENSELYQHNYAAFAARHPAGLTPYISGTPVIG